MSFVIPIVRTVRLCKTCYNRVNIVNRRLLTCPTKVVKTTKSKDIAIFTSIFTAFVAKMVSDST